MDKENNVYVTGYTMSSNFPVTTGVYDESANGNDDVFVSKLAADGSNLIYSTYIGGSSSDNAFALVLDSEKNTYILGNTTSNNFPVTTSAYDTSANGYYDIFVSKLSADGSNLIYSTFLGGTDLDIGLALALDNEKNAYVTGYTGSTDFPVTSGAYNNSLNNGQYFYDIFVSKLSSDGSALIYSTFIGGRDNDYGESLALDSENNVYITGVTHSSNFPTTVSAYDENYNGGDDVFVSKLSADGSDLINSTFLGSTNDDVAYSLALDGENNCYITGYTQSADFPTTGGAFDTSFNGSLDAFVGKLSVDGTNLIYSTFLGGIDWDAGNAIVLDSKNNAYVTGYTRSSDFPIASNFYDKTYNGHNDVFLNKLTADGSRLIYSTFLGGNFSDNGNDLAIDNNNNVYITGLTQSGNFPTTSSAFNRTSNGNNEAFVSKISIMKPSKISNTDIIPLEYILKQNYPNPFNPATMIDFTISKNTFVELSIFDVVGKKIQTLVNENLAPGNYKYRFDGSQLASGVYLYMLKTKEFTRVKEMLFIK